MFRKASRIAHEILKLIEPKGWLRHVLSPQPKSSVPLLPPRRWRPSLKISLFTGMCSLVQCHQWTLSFWSIECSINVNTLARPMWKGEEFVWNKGRYECFLKALSRKSSGLHVRYRFKGIPWRATGGSPFECVDKYKTPREIGEICGNYGWNAYWIIKFKRILVWNSRQRKYPLQPSTNEVWRQNTFTSKVWTKVKKKPWF